MRSTGPAARERSFGDLLSDLRGQLARLLQQERELATVEIKRNVTELGKDSALLIGGAVIGALAVLTLLGALCAGVVALLALGLPLIGVAVWLGPLIVGVVLVCVAAGVSWAGYRRFQRARVVPEKTAQSLREDKQWLQGRFS